MIYTFKPLGVAMEPNLPYGEFAWPGVPGKRETAVVCMKRGAAACARERDFSGFRNPGGIQGESGKKYAPAEVKAGA